MNDGKKEHSISYTKDNISLDALWIFADKLHRDNGPALIFYNKDGIIESREYYINGRRYSKEEYLNLISPQNKIKVLLHE